MVSRQPGTALYEQLADRLRRQIADGTLPPGQVVPSEQQLMQESGLSRLTVRRAVEVLKSDGLVVVRHGQATRVADFAEKQEIIPEPGSTVEARMPRPDERQMLAERGEPVPDGWPVLYVAPPAGSHELPELYPAHLYRVRVRDADTQPE